MDDQQKRLFLALVLCAGAAILWQMFIFRPPPPGAAGEGSGAAVATEQEVGAEDATEGTPSQPISEGSGQPSLSEAPGEPSQPDVPLLDPQRLAGNRFIADFVNRGAVMAHQQITEPEQYIPREEFGGVFPGADSVLHDFAVRLDGVPALTHDSAYHFIEDESEVVSDDDGAITYSRLVYRWSDGNIQIDKTFSVDPDHPYVVDFAIAITDLSGSGAEIEGVEVEVWADASNSESGGIFNPIANTLQSACFVNDDLETESGEDVVGKSYQGSALWAGVMDRYFLAAVAVPDGAAEGCAFAADEQYIGSMLRLGEVSLAPGETHTIELIGYTGPKAADALTAAGSQLPRSVEYGWFGFLAKPMRWVLTSFYGFIPNWGVAIILLTIMVKLLMFPLTHKAFKSMERMKEIQPKLVELREKYKNDKAKMTEETMKLYREHNVNPFGCLPMLLQMPIYIALYRTIYSSVELYKAEFAFWIHDLSQADPLYILPVLMALTMFGQQLLMPTAVDNPQMKWVMRLMPLMFGLFMLVLPSGLVLYIFISSLLGILQQWFIRRQRKKETESENVSIPQASNLTRQQRRQRARRQE